MSPSTQLVPAQQEEIAFYEDRIVALLVPAKGQTSPQILVPVRPICEYLGLNWSGQHQRIRRDRVLSSVSSMCVTHTEAGPREALCLPVEFLHGWLLGISLNRVHVDLQDKLERYQRECYAVLWQAFKLRTLESLGPEFSVEQLTDDMSHLKLSINGILDYLWLSHQQDAVVRGLLQKVQLDVHEIGGAIEPGDELTDRQRRTIYELALEVTALLAQSGERRNPFAIVFGSLKKNYNITTYRVLPRGKYRQAHEFLSGWKSQLQQQIRAAGDEPCIL